MFRGEERQAKSERFKSSRDLRPHNSRNDSRGWSAAQNNREHLPKGVATELVMLHFDSQQATTGDGGASMIRLSDNLRTVINSDGGAVLDVFQGKIFQLNATGALILDLLARGCTEERIVAEISQRCSVDTAVSAADVHSFLTSLRNHNLITDVDRP
jgi:hypothetical protein